MQVRNAEERVRQRLQQAGPQAVELLLQAMRNEELPYKERIDIAKDLLNRSFGKNPAVQESTPTLRVVLTEEVDPYAG